MRSQTFIIAGVTFLLGCAGAERDAQRATADTSLAARTAAIEQDVEVEQRRLGVPGFALAIVRDDSVILMKGFGLRDVEAGLPVTTRTLFAIGSITKTFTALAAVISADEGVLSLDDHPRRFVPYFRLRDPVADTGVTLRDLLAHRSGVPDDLAAGWYERYPTREELIRVAMRSAPAGAFREVWRYNNYMYLVAGEAIAAAHHTTYDSVITSRLFGPLGMHASGFSVGAMERGADASWGHDGDSTRRRLPLRSLAFLDGIAPAGAIVSNIEDMARWLRLMTGGGLVDGRRLVSENGFRAMLAEAVTTGSGHYGLGLFIEPWQAHARYFHHGGVLGFGSRFEFMPDQRLGFVILANVDDQQLPNAVREIVYAQLVSR